MSKRLTGLNPLAYIGVEPTTPPGMYLAKVSPTPTDSKNFNLGDMWLNETTESLYVLVSLAGGLATWVTTFGGAATNFITNSGTAVESGGNISIVGDGNAISTSGSGSTITIAFDSTANLTVNDLTVDGSLTLTGFTGGVLTATNSGVVGEVTTTNHSLLIGNSSGTLSSLGSATNGEIPIGSTGSDPVLATITGGTGIAVTNGAGSISIATNGTFSSPITVPNGGTGDSSFTAYAVICGGTTSTTPLQSVVSVGTSGQILTSNGAGALPTFQNNGGAAGAVTFHTDGADATASGNAITFSGAGGITTSGSGSTVTITASGTGIAWITVAGTSSAMLIDHGYIPDNVGICTLTLPSTAAVGDTLYVMGLGSGGWVVAQNTGQSINFGSFSTTAGVGGSLASTQRYNAITLVCSIANTTFNAIASIGNITVI